MELKNQTVTILGFSRSGQEAAKLCHSLGASLRISDNSRDPNLKKVFRKLNLGNARAEFGRHTEKFIIASQLVVLSPGIRLDSPPVIWARKRNIPVVSEVELAFRFCKAPVVAVTGTSGKTTVTTLIGAILKLTKRRVWVCGNIGTPFSKFVLGIRADDIVVLEISSFQLETIDKFKPYVAVFLNFSQNHLDRHADMEEYLDAKKRIFMNQAPTDYALLNYGEATVRSFAKEIKSKVVFFNRNENSGITNPNYLAALAVGEIFGLDKRKCLKVLKGFKGVEHRLELVRNIKGIDFINDSKATTVLSAIWALNSIDKPIIMVAGGRDKGADFSVIRDLVRNRIKEMILIGEAKAKLKKAFKGVVKIKEQDSLPGAVKLAFNDAQKGDCVLLCPMCASFDMFKDYEDRGRFFKSLVHKL